MIEEKIRKKLEDAQNELEKIDIQLASSGLDSNLIKELSKKRANISEIVDDFLKRVAATGRRSQHSGQQIPVSRALAGYACFVPVVCRPKSTRVLHWPGMLGHPS